MEVQRGKREEGDLGAVDVILFHVATHASECALHLRVSIHSDIPSDLATWHKITAPQTMPGSLKCIK